MSKKRKTVKVSRKGRSVDIAYWVYDYNRRKRAERKAAKVGPKLVKNN